MAKATMILHCGARAASEEELASVPTPPPEGRWRPLSHASVLSRVKETLGEAGYAIRGQQIALSRNDARFFATLDLEAALAENVYLAVAVRSSIDKSFPLGLVGGQRVTVCDNLCFRGDLIDVRRKHTTHGERRFAEGIADAVARLADFHRVEAERVRVMQATELTEDRADSLILRAFEKGIVSARTLPRVVREWREPTFPQFEGRTLFNLLQAFTTVLGERARAAPHEFAVQTMRLNHHLLRWSGGGAQAQQAS